MTQQLTMALEWEQRRTIEDRFWQFHASNPEIYAELVRLCREARAAGRRKIGIRMLWERLRWTLYIERGSDEYKLNDHMTSRYARLIQQQEPELDGIFETRELRAV